MQPFQVAIPQADLDDLRRRLADTRWPDLFDVGWDRGVPVSYLKELAEHWRSDFDWRAAEARLNQFPQFVTEIDGANVHFIHVRSPEPNAIPLLITHGWPGSVVEFLEVIGPLTDPRGHGGDPSVAFDVVIPSLPGYGFSGVLKEPGWSLQRVAVAWAQLMNQLGYDKYVAQGADFGAVVSIMLGLVDPDHLAGVHVNLLLTTPSGEPGELDGLSAEDEARLARISRFVNELAGSMKQQATRPHTVAYGLTDSPVGQLAWIVEKFKDWTDSKAVPEDAVDRDLLLTLVSIYWLTGTAGSAAQMYREVIDMLPITTTVGRLPTITAPVGVALYPRSLFLPVRRLADRDLPNIVHWVEYDRGGHFAAMEEPDLFVDDLRAYAQALKQS